MSVKEFVQSFKEVEFDMRLHPTIDEKRVDEILAALRGHSKLPLPAQNYLNTQAIDLTSDQLIWHRFVPHLLTTIKPELGVLAHRRIVIDLDETLLLNSHICPELWSFGRGYHDSSIQPAYRYRHLYKPWLGHVKAALGRSHYDTANKRLYPFLKNPRHIVVFRPGMVSGLQWLKQQGADLILVTASARRRVEYLLQRFPLLAEIFGRNIITADDMTRYYLTATTLSLSSGQDSASTHIHRRRPYSLAAKTPLLVRSLLQCDGDYDFIVDDSATTADLFHATDLAHKLIWVGSNLTGAGYGLQIVTEIVNRLTQQAYLKRAAPHSLVRLQPDSLYDQFVSSVHPPIRLEDPFYWPLCHTSDQLSL